MKTTARATTIVLATLTFGAVAPIAAQEDLPTLEKVLGQMIESMSAAKAWSADIENHTNMMGMEMIMTGTTVASGSKSVSEISMSMDMPEELKAHMGDDDVNMFGEDMKMKIVVDANNVQWTEMNLFGETQVMKFNMNEIDEDLASMMMPFGGEDAFTDIMQNPEKAMAVYQTMFDMKVTGVDTIDGAKVFLLEGSIKKSYFDDLDLNDPEEMAEMMEMMGGFGEKITMAIGVDDGFMRRMTLGGTSGPPMMTMNMKNIKLNIDVDESAFVYSPPEGAEVLDMAEMMAAGGFDQENGTYQPGEIAPDFTGQTIDGKSVSLSDYEGKVVLIDFWATWCGPCIQELPHVIETYEEYNEKGLEIIGISLDDDRGALERFFEKNPKVTWPTIFDGEGWKSAIGEQYGVNAIPYTVLVAPDGIISATNLRGNALPRAVAALLEDE